MLDPNNPRLSLGWSAAQQYTPAQLRSNDLQEKVYAAVLKAKHRVKDLIQSIAAKGFLRGAQPMIVRPLGSSSDLLVLEGNRRSAAIRYLLGRAKELKPGIVETIKRIPVSVFEYIDGSSFSQEEVIDVVLGTIHIEGPQEWGAMEKSYYVYRSYERELERKYSTKKFLFDKNIAKALAENYSQSANKIKTILGIYRVFQQLRDDKYEVSADDYSLIEMAITSPAGKDEFFTYDSEKLRMHTLGRERFSSLCLERDAPIRNPSEFRAFNYVLEHGTEYERNQILEERKAPTEIKAVTRQRVTKRVFLEKLEAIKDEIEKLKPADFRDTNAEIDLIVSIKKLIDGKLLPLSNGAVKAKTKY
jgi:hypothetical protein